MCIFSQQTTRDSKRRASKEASALSQDGQPVSEDPEPVECVWWKVESPRSLWRGGRWCEQAIGRWCGDLQFEFRGWCFAGSRPSVSSIPNTSTCIMSSSKDPGMLHICCAIASAWVKQQRMAHKQRSRSPPCFFLPWQWCRSGSVSLW